jgi:type IV pilus assembly protein PilN
MKVPVNLATRPMETHRGFLTLYGSLVAISAVLFLGLGWHVFSIRKADAAFHIQSEAAAAEIDSLINQRDQLDRFFSQPENAVLHDRASFINSIIDAQSFNWTRMFVDLERVLPGGVRVISIEPKQVNGQAAVKLTVGAISENAKRDFLVALERSDAFSHVELISVRVPAKAPDGDQIILELNVFYSRA